MHNQPDRVSSRFLNISRLSILGVAMILPTPTIHAETLVDVLHATLQHPGIHARQLTTDAAYSQLQASQLKYLGAGSLSTDLTRFNNGQFDGAFTSSNFTQPSFNQNQLRFNVNYRLPIDLFGSIASTQALAQSSLDASRLAQQQEVLLKLHQTTVAWVKMQALIDKKSALDLESKRVQTMQKRVAAEVKSGLSAKTDLLLAQTEAQRVAFELVQLQGEKLQLQTVIEDALGYPLTDATLLENWIKRSDTYIPAWQEIPASQLLPVQMAQIEEQSAEQQSQIARLALLPSLSAGAGITRYTDVAGGNNLWYVGANLSMPIDPSLWQSKSSANAKAAAAKDAKEASLRSSNQNMVQLKSAYNNAIAMMKAAQQEVALRKDMLAVQDELTKVGMSSAETLLHHEKALVEAVNHVASAKAAAIEAWSAAQVLSGVATQAYIRGVVRDL